MRCGKDVSLLGRSIRGLVQQPPELSCSRMETGNFEDGS